VVCDSLDAQEESLYLSNWQETNAAIGIILLPVEDVLLMLEEIYLMSSDLLQDFRLKSIP
jgi:hypothetical protein